MEVLKEDDDGEIFERTTWLQKRNERVEMRACPFKDYISELGCRFRKFDTWPLSDVLDKMIWMLGKPPMSEDRDAGIPIAGKLKKQKKEIYKIATNGRKDYVVVGKSGV